MKISVIMAVYNGGERMRRTIDSVLKQTLKDFEFLCIDDGSNDGVSDKILDEYEAKDSRIKVIHRKNKGVCATLNECYLKATGDFVARVDQDDVFHPQLLELCKYAVEKNRLDFLAFRYSVMEEGKLLTFDRELGKCMEVSCWDDALALQNPAGFCDALASIHTDTWSHFLRRELAVTHPFHLEKGLTRLFAQLREHIRWGVTREVLYFYDAGVSTSMTHQPFSKEELGWDMADIKNIISLYADKIEAGDPLGEWKTICSAYVVKYLKINYNKIRRSKGVVSKEELKRMYVAFAEALRDFFESGIIPMNLVRLRHRIAYWWIMFRYRGSVEER